MMKLIGVSNSGTAAPWLDYTEHLEWFNLITQYPYNMVRVLICKDQWDTNRLAQNGVTYRQHLQDIIDHFHAQGKTVIASAFAYSEWGETVGARQCQLIMTTTLQDQWIATFKDVVATLNIDGLVLMNEPPNGTPYGYTKSQIWNAYRPFMERASRAYRIIKPNLPLYVMSAPYWDMTYIANDPLPLDNIVYVFHLYGNDVMQIPAIANAVNTGNWSEVARLYKLYLLTAGNVPALEWGGIGLQAVLNKGLPVFCMECGVPSPRYTYWSELLQIHFNLMEELDIGYCEHALHPDYHDTSFGMLTIDGTALNEVGQLWAQNLPTPAPPIPPTPAPPIPLWKAAVVWLSILGGAGAAIKLTE